ncbi:MAG: CDP-alcohol phosphatidyltransferase family protein [Candidatus Magasanikbacteria bacterium]|nr:CDP-alcohol phosphatidyltransferase family protein [Candidatus Magasanikbacteria bacterium]
MLATFAHFIYDERLIPFNRQNAANYTTIMGAWLARISFYLFGIILVAFAMRSELTPWMLGLRYAAIGFGILAGICDALDGFIARKLGCVTELGRIPLPFGCVKSCFLC